MDILRALHNRSVLFASSLILLSSNSDFRLLQKESLAELETIDPQSPSDELFESLEDASLTNDPEESCVIDLECCEEMCLVCDVCSWVGLRYTGGSGLGWDGGYLTLEGLFFFNTHNPSLWPFIDLRAHRFNDGDYAANAGLGIRYVPCCSRLFWGVNAYFDYRSCDRFDENFFQAGVGFELLGDCWEFRLNGYIPFDSKRTIKKCRFFYPGGHFIFLDRIKEAPGGFDAEVGRYFWRDCCYSLYFGIGPYYYGENCNGTIVGGRARIEMEICDWLYFGGGVTYDEVFNLRGYGFIGIRFPFGCDPCRQNFCERRMRQRVFRNEIIVVDEYCRWKFNFGD